MSNAVTITGIELYASKVISGLKSALAALRGFSLDFTDELTQPGASLDVALVTADAAGDFNATSSNFSRAATDAKKITVTKSAAVIAGYNVSAAQYANLRPSFWEGKGVLNVAAVCNNILGKVAALVTAANYGDLVTDKIAVTEATFGRKAVAKIRAAAITKGLTINNSVLALSPAYFSALLGDLDANVYGGAEAMKTGAIPGLLGFKMVVEIPQLTIPGFVAHPDAIAIGSAVFRPVSDKPYDSVTQIVEPETGLTLTVVEYCDGASGALSVTVNCVVAVGVGNENGLLRLVE
jgi:hypothetical protein